MRDRKAHKEVFVYGDYQELSPDDPSVFAYGRMSEIGERWLVILNFSGTKHEYPLPETLVMEFWACSTYTRGRADTALGGSIVVVGIVMSALLDLSTHGKLHSYRPA